MKKADIDIRVRELESDISLLKGKHIYELEKAVGVPKCSTLADRMQRNLDIITGGYESLIEAHEEAADLNPIKIKGVDIVLQLSRIFRNVSFEVYESWWHTDKQYIRHLIDMPNITVRSYTRSLSELFIGKRICLFPSQCEEGFGRSAIEASLNMYLLSLVM